MNKPIIEHRNSPSYDWTEIQNWITFKTGKNVRDWAGKYSSGKTNNIPYQDFWHWITDRNEIHNGCYFYLNLNDEEVEDEKKWLFVKEILAVLREEFPEANNEMYCWVSW